MKRIKWWTYAVPALVFVVAAVQYYHVQHGLTRWKGGGFGMYSEISFQKNEVWIATPDTFLLVEDFFPNWQRYSVTIGEVKRYPNEKNMKRLYQALWQQNPEQTYTIELWRPRLNMSNFQYEKTKIYEYANYN